ncbi:MAG TPA: polyprenyl synthetase family protein [Prolixibacteraceae bacterium]|nr:polyprenyl synthetase family protein [Prolixibacteraceae bacterium]
MKEIYTENKLPLLVPPEEDLRVTIRKKSVSWMAERGESPPVSYDQLAGFADLLIAQHGWDHQYKAFVMICAGNAIWRSVVGSVPFQRRMLLLPQCLKNSKLCRADEDELGLLCKECGNCHISGLIREAEKLGYITIVAEGTTIASRLVESGQVDAIIGVGCMEVLRKIFASVNKYSVPAIGVPLISNGCTDTKADRDWIMEEVRYLDQFSSHRMINLNELREQTASLFSAENIDKMLGLGSSKTDEMVREIMLAGGKRIRPMLTLLAYQAFCSSPDPNVLSHLALSVECFHKASLVHDDIEDDDTLRYGKETIHHRYGIPVAINTGDLLIGEGYRLISGCPVDPVIITKCLGIFAAGQHVMASGQGAELLARRDNAFLPLEEILQIFKNKTAEAFKVSLLAGAVAGGADESSLQILEEFSHLMGTAYQLMDDLEDITDPEEASSWRNPSVAVSLLAEKAEGDETDLIRKAVIQNELDPILGLIRKYQIEQMAGDLLSEYLNRLDPCLSQLRNIPLKIALHELVGKAFSKYL